jgi:hypothetical protein
MKTREWRIQIQTGYRGDVVRKRRVGNVLGFVLDAVLSQPFVEELLVLC